jgi:methyl-accepting chemotaxis protein
VADRSTPPARSSSGFAGPRLPLAIAGLAASSAVAALIVASVFRAFADPRTTAIEEELADHGTLGEQALAALEEARAELDAQNEALWAERKKAAAHRASELALFGSLRVSEARRKTGEAKLTLPRSQGLAKHERLGLVDTSRDRIVQLEGLAEGSTVSASLPVLAKALRKKSRRVPYTHADASGVWAIGPPIGGDLRVVARVELLPDPPRGDAIARARRVIGGLTSGEASAGDGSDPLWLLLFAAILAAGAAAVWARIRVTAPIARSLDVARDFVHGRGDARADPGSGGRDAREIALAINALIDRAERAIERGRAERGDDLSNAVLAIERLGKGDLREAIVPPGPIAQALDRARRDLLDRVTEMHHAALQVATRASEIAPAARVVTDSSGEQLTALRRLASASEETMDEIRRKAAELEMAIGSLSSTAQEHRHAIQDVRASLSGLSRRVMSLRATAEEARSLSTRADTIDQALSMLSRLAGQSDAPATKARATALVGDARAAMSEIGDKLSSLEQEMLRAAHGLEILAQAQPEPPAMFEASVTQPFYDAIAILVRTIELTVTCVAALERSAKNTAESSDAMYAAARQAIDLVPRLGAALSAIRLGTSFEEQLLERLARMKAEVEAAKRTDGLTPEGERMLEEVMEASEAARAKLIRLAQTTEAAIRAMRG